MCGIRPAQVDDQGEPGAETAHGMCDLEGVNTPVPPPLQTLPAGVHGPCHRPVLRGTLPSRRLPGHPALPAACNGPPLHHRSVTARGCGATRLSPTRPERAPTADAG